MPTQPYNQDQLWKVYETLPEELKQAVFSAENADHTFSICERYGIEECSQLASLVGLVLMGVMLPRDFEGALQKDLGLDQETAQRVAQEINRFIFYPVKQQLEQIHKAPGEKAEGKKDLGVATPRHSDAKQITEDTYVVTETEEQPQEEPLVEEPKTKEPDPYREATE